MYTVRELCKLSKLSRGTLLYYDSLGILKPIVRSAANYRLYSEASVECLKKICMYRDAGVPLADIAALLSTPGEEDTTAVILERTLRMLNDEARRVKEKQRAVIHMIRRNNGDFDVPAPDVSDVEKLHDELMELMPLFAFDLDKYKALSSGEHIPVHEEERMLEHET